MSLYFGPCVASCLFISSSFRLCSAPCIYMFLLLLLLFRLFWGPSLLLHKTPLPEDVRATVVQTLVPGLMDWNDLPSFFPSPPFLLLLFTFSHSMWTRKEELCSLSLQFLIDLDRFFLCVVFGSFLFIAMLFIHGERGAICYGDGMSTRQEYQKEQEQ